VIKASEGGGVVFSLEKIGPLKPVKVTSKITLTPTHTASATQTLSPSVTLTPTQAIFTKTPQPTPRSLSITFPFVSPILRYSIISNNQAYTSFTGCIYSKRYRL
jgi:hypothetical protein